MRSLRSGLHFSAPRVSVSRKLPLQLFAGLVLYTLLRPLLGVAHEVLLALVAGGFHAVVASNVWVPLLSALPIDPVYTGTAVRSLGGVDVQGVAIRGVLGEYLSSVAPSLFLSDPSNILPDAFASMVALPGAPSLGRGVAALTADALWLAAGFALWARTRHHGVPLATLGVLLQGQVVVNHLLKTRLSLADIDASGVPFALSVLSSDRNTWFTQRLADLDPSLQQVLGGGLALLAGILLACLFTGAGIITGRVLAWWRRGSFSRQAKGNSSRPRLPYALVAALGLVAALSPIGSFGRGVPNWRTQPVQAAPILHLSGVAQPAGSSSSSAKKGSVVSLDASPDGTWTYRVNGTAEVIRGVGYNPQYAKLSPAERTAFYDRDFGAMHNLGINTVEGWFEDQFDSVTLDSAAHNDIGVLLPFELNQDWDYTNPAVQQEILDRVSAWVRMYRGSPALRMWAPGNENIHRVLYPNWVSKVDDPVARAKAQAFASFLPVLIDRIHSLDPTHPVIYRDAEDVYLPWLKPALEQGGISRPWLVYGANVYSLPRLQQIINAWPAQWGNGPLVISEFSPSGVSGDARADGYVQDWDAVRSRPGLVLGGLAYTWATNGPEQLDRLFGLVDPNGVPVDSTLERLSRAYLTEAGAAPGAGNP